jgi:hypothetical protein
LYALAVTNRGRGDGSRGSRPLLSRETLFAIERRVARRIYGRGPEREHWLRQTMYAHLDAFFAALPPGAHDALEVSGQFYAHYPWRHYEHWHYPDFDVCDPGPADAQFSVVICDQVLEHVVDPFRGARALADLCVPGGYVVVGVPFLVRVHPAPTDYWRFTADGLRVLLERAGLCVQEVHSWGNRHCANANFLVWARKPRWASNVNEPLFPVNVWAIAQKPTG